MGITTLVFQMEFELGSSDIPEALRRAVDLLTNLEEIHRVEVSIVQRPHGRQLRIEGRKEEERT